MILSNRDIREWIEEERLIIDPFDPESVGPESVDLHLDGRFTTLETRGMIEYIDLAEQNQHFRSGKVGMWTNTLDAEFYIIHPGRVVIAYVQEYIKLPDNLAGRVDGRSTFAQLGLQVESAGLIHAGWEGHLVLELSNLGDVPIRVSKGLPICQVSFYPLSSPAGIL